MSEMIERIAKAIWEVRQPNPPGHAAWEDYSGFGPSKTERSFTLAQARAAIQAMREPTLEMLKSGGQTPFHGADTPRVFWQAMIDEALAEPPKPD